MQSTSVMNNLWKIFFFFWIEITEAICATSLCMWMIPQHFEVKGKEEIISCHCSRFCGNSSSARLQDTEKTVARDLAVLVTLLLPYTSAGRRTSEISIQISSLPSVCLSVCLSLSISCFQSLLPPLSPSWPSCSETWNTLTDCAFCWLTSCLTMKWLTYCLLDNELIDCLTMKWLTYCLLDKLVIGLLSAWQWSDWLTCCLTMKWLTYFLLDNEVINLLSAWQWSDWLTGCLTMKWSTYWLLDNQVIDHVMQLLVCSTIASPLPLHDILQWWWWWWRCWCCWRMRMVFVVMCVALCCEPHFCCRFAHLGM